MNFIGKILLIDDEPHIRKFLSLLLRKLGSPTFLEAGSGEEGVEIYQREKPDLVLLDVNLPGMDGIETLTRLHEIDADCLVIMMTSVANRRTVDEAAAKGAVYYLRKDSPKEEILAAVTQIVAEAFGPQPDAP